MSYFPCARCGKYVGVIGRTIYNCDCKPLAYIMHETKIDKPTFWQRLCYDLCPYVLRLHSWLYQQATKNRLMRPGPDGLKYVP